MNARVSSESLERGLSANLNGPSGWKWTFHFGPLNPPPVLAEWPSAPINHERLLSVLKRPSKAVHHCSVFLSALFLNSALLNPFPWCAVRTGPVCPWTMCPFLPDSFHVYLFILIEKSLRLKRFKNQVKELSDGGFCYIYGITVGASMNSWIWLVGWKMHSFELRR